MLNERGRLMYRLRKTFAATVLAGAAIAGPVMAIPANAAQTGLVNVDVLNLFNNSQTTLLQNVSVPVAAALCGVQANVLSAALANSNTAACPALTTLSQVESVVGANS